MVGGTVIEVAERDGKLFVDCADRPYSKIETCAIYVELTDVSRQIEMGDALWWQGGWAMWTPKRNRLSADEGQHLKCGVDYDIKIRRIGYSGVKLNRTGATDADA